MTRVNGKRYRSVIIRCRSIFLRSSRFTKRYDEARSRVCSISDSLDTTRFTKSASVKTRRGVIYIWGAVPVYFTRLETQTPAAFR